MDGENIIYIIIAIVYFIVSALGSKKKAKQKKEKEAARRQQQPAPQREIHPPEREFHAPEREVHAPEREVVNQPKPEPTIQDIFETLFGEEAPPPPVVEKRPPPPKPPKPFLDPMIEVERKRVESDRISRERSVELAGKRREMMAASMRQHLSLLQKNDKRSKSYTKNAATVYKDISLKDAIIVQAILERPYQ